MLTSEIGMVGMNTVEKESISVSMEAKNDSIGMDSSWFFGRCEGEMITTSSASSSYVLRGAIEKCNSHMTTSFKVDEPSYLLTYTRDLFPIGLK